MISAAGEGTGIALDVTGVGAIAGLPLNAVSAAGIAGGVGMMGIGVGDIARPATGDDRVQVMQPNNSSGGGGSGELPTKTNRIAEHLTPKDLEGAQRELDGEVVATKGDGTPFDQVTEVREAQQGLVNRIHTIQRQLADTREEEPVSAAGHDLRSLDDIEGTTWGPTPADATTLVARIHQLRGKPVGELTAADLRLLIGQQVGSDVLVPQACALLKREPLVDTDLYPGDLLAAVLRLPPDYWQQHPSSAEEMKAVLDSVEELPSELATGAANFRRAV